MEEFSKSVQSAGVLLPWLALEASTNAHRGSCDVDRDSFLARRQVEASKSWNQLTLTRTVIDLKVSVGTFVSGHEAQLLVARFA